MRGAIDALEAARPSTDPAEFYSVVHAALASAVKVIARADDSSGIIGDACRRLLELHPQAAADAGVAPAKLVDWMIKFQLDGDVDYFELDPVAYAPALGDASMKAYRARLEAVRSTLAPEPADGDRWSVPDRHERWVLDWNDRRLAVLDRDIDAIIRTHARDRKVAVWLQDTAKAFEEIGEIDLAIDWARQAADHHPDHQALQAADYVERAKRPDFGVPCREAGPAQVHRSDPLAAIEGDRDLGGLVVEIGEQFELHDRLWAGPGGDPAPLAFAVGFELSVA